MGTRVIGPTRKIGINDTDFVSIAVPDKLDAGEILSNVSDVSVESTDDPDIATNTITVDSPQVKTGTYVDDNTKKTIAVGHAGQFRVVTTDAEAVYTVKFKLTTSTSRVWWRAVRLSTRPCE